MENRLKRFDNGIFTGIALVVSSLFFPHVDELRDAGELCEGAYGVSAGGAWAPTLAHTAAGVFVLLSVVIYLGTGKQRGSLALALLSGVYFAVWSLGVYNWIVKTCFRPAPGSALALGGFFVMISATLGHVVLSRWPIFRR